MSTDSNLRDSVTVALPKGVTVTIGRRTITAKGPLGSITRPFPNDVLLYAPADGGASLTLQIPPNRKKAQALLHAWERHLGNLAVGVTKGFEAKMKVVAAHFPMKVQAKDGEVVIENFLGEKYPRTARLLPGVTATVDGDFVILSGHDVEVVGQSAANVERTTRIRDYDPRVFQDGIYLVEHAHPKEA
ncbi:MAG TPA: 50S ribosomal protein L6 [Thermoplasmata archaeon]|nr:50S ribosomal protein L6 [Thermoplasmata archaeon]